MSPPHALQPSGGRGGYFQVSGPLSNLAAAADSAMSDGDFEVWSKREDVFHDAMAESAVLDKTWTELTGDET